MAGAAVLALDRLVIARAPDPAAPTAADSRPVVVDDATLDDIRQRQRDGLGRPPTDAELAAAVERWIDEEALVREAERLGLGRRDPVIRDRLATRMADLYRARAVPDAPDDATLRRLYAADPDAWRLPPRLTLRQLFVAGATADPSAHAAARARAEALLAAAAASPDAVPPSPDPPPGGPLLRGRRPERLGEVYGPGFVAGLLDAPLDRWLLRPSAAGWHLVRVERRTPGRQLGFDEARDRLGARYAREQAAAAAERALDAARARVVVEGWPR